MRTYHVYILASLTRALYVGVTSQLGTRVMQHKAGTYGGHTHRYRIHHLVYFETYDDVRVAIAREKQLKRFPRARKFALVERHNPDWRDLSIDWMR